ncbi:MAG: phosphoglucosamine mutase [Candidatus Endonucleobacter bathymodioli]|uniref:Phosphoglucosamine mutase n=1 Tax=Candidatus Endonucleibacter bathymodioli TaxID=539814 RepID=A0AA90SS86_9GAMM|nr:phosphoglucosamine mutase [Candidatus Endonucleobacter bathymodioli]
MVCKYFGTDGIRGKVGEFPISPDFVLKLGWAAGKILSSQGRGKVVIGKDTRISGYMFESALEAGLSAAGVDVVLTGPMPTPAIAYLTKTFNCQAGIVISASHNPHYDNGIKFFSRDGAKLPNDVELRIEALIDGDMSVVETAALGKVSRLDDAAGRYIEYCKASTVPQLDLSGLKIVVDAGHGATYQVGPAVFKELGATVTVINAEPNGFNINQGCGATSPNNLADKVKFIGADLGVAFDGDGDRVIMVDEHANSLDGDELLYIIAVSRKDQKILRGGVVGTLMTNLGMEQALKNKGIPFSRAKVGDRYVNELMDEKKWQLGGESSGHIICRDVSTTGDGIVAALQVIKAMKFAGKTLGELKKGVTKYPQTMINVKVMAKYDLASNSSITEAVLLSENQLGHRGRVLLRPSGTEPVIRIMVEGVDAIEVKAHAEKLVVVVENALL